MKRYVKASKSFINDLNDLLNEIGVDGFGEKLDDINIPDLVKTLRDKYDWLYEMESYPSDYNDMLAIGDFVIDNYGSFIRKIASVRKDVLSSDREVAALGYAIEQMIR